MKALYNIINFKKNNKSLNVNTLTKDYNFDKLYKIASKHFVIPTLYNAIKQKKIEDYFPKEFMEAITHITTLNQKRNSEIISQIKQISALLNNYQIDYVFIKGAGILISNQYRSLSDRMIGDIDILVSKKDILKANDLLISNSYTPIDIGFDTKFIKHRHLPRLISQSNVCAVELHTNVLDKYQSIYQPASILKNKRIIDNVPIPCKRHLILHSILDHQINDYGFLKWDFTFRAIYDYLVLTKKNDYYYKNLLALRNKYIRRFFLVKFIYFEKPIMKSTCIEKLQIFFLKWRIKHFKFNNWYCYLIIKLSSLKMLPHRLLNLFRSSDYRRFSYNRTIAFVKKIISP